MICLIYGQENFFVSNKIIELKNKFFENVDENFKNITTSDFLVDGFSKLFSIFEQTSFSFYEKKFLLIENSSFLSSATAFKKIKAKELHNVLNLLNSLKNDDDALIVFTFDGKDINKNDLSNLFDNNEKYFYPQLSKKEWIVFARKRLEKANLKMNDEAFNLFLDKVNYNLYSFKNEIEKLHLYKEDSLITCEDIKEIVATNVDDDVFTLVNYIVNGNSEEIYKTYEELKAISVEPITLIALLTSNLLFLDQVLFLDGLNYDAYKIAEILHANIYRVKITLNSKSNVNSKIISEYLDNLYRLDKDIKLGNIDRFYGFELFLTKIKKHPSF